MKPKSALAVKRRSTSDLVHSRQTQKILSALQDLKEIRIFKRVPAKPQNLSDTAVAAEDKKAKAQQRLI